MPGSLFSQVTDRSISSKVVARRCSVKICSKFIEFALQLYWNHTLPEHLFLRTPLEGCFYILQLHWKKGLQHRCFLINFARCLRHLFYRTLPGNCFCSTEKSFTNKIVKNPYRKEKKMEATCKKKNDAQNLITIYIKFSYPIQKFIDNL